jgi:hypothetical protein
MCECGCGAINPIAAYQIGNSILIIDEYYGCKDCNNPIGFTLHIFSKKEAKEWIDFKPEIFKPKPPISWDYKNFSFIGKNELMSASEEYEKEFKEYDTLKDFMCDFGLEILQTALKKRKFKNPE